MANRTDKLHHYEAFYIYDRHIWVLMMMYQLHRLFSAEIDRTREGMNSKGSRRLYEILSQLISVNYKSHTNYQVGGQKYYVAITEWRYL
jgi:hypothetical protein